MAETVIFAIKMNRYTNKCRHKSKYLLGMTKLSSFNCIWYGRTEEIMHERNFEKHIPKAKLRFCFLKLLEYLQRIIKVLGFSLNRLHFEKFPS